MYIVQNTATGHKWSTEDEASCQALLMLMRSWYGLDNLRVTIYDKLTNNAKVIGPEFGPVNQEAIARYIELLTENPDKHPTRLIQNIWPGTGGLPLGQGSIFDKIYENGFYFIDNITKLDAAGISNKGIIEWLNQEILSTSSKPSENSEV